MMIRYRVLFIFMTDFLINYVYQLCTINALRLEFEDHYEGCLGK